MNIKLKNLLKNFQNDIPKLSLNYKKPLIYFEKKISNPSDAVKLMRANIDDCVLEVKEHLWVILLTSTNKVIGVSTICIGGFNNVSTNTREISQLALLSNAGKLIVVHNHTSDICLPSDRDIKYTRNLKKVLELFEIGLMDHIILTSDSYYSFNSNGKLNQKAD